MGVKTFEVLDSAVRHFKRWGFMVLKGRVLWSALGHQVLDLQVRIGFG